MTLASSVPRRVTVSIALLLVAFAAIVAAKEAGWATSMTSKSAIALVLGLMMTCIGNFVPKLTVPGTPASALRFERRAGMSLAVGGLAIVPVAVLFPSPWAPIASAVVGLASLTAAALYWLQLGATHSSVEHTTRTSLRGAFAHMLLAIGWVLAMFPADAFWGNTSTWPMLIGYMVSSFGLIAWQRVPRAQQEG